MMQCCLSKSLILKHVRANHDRKGLSLHKQTQSLGLFVEGQTRAGTGNLRVHTPTCGALSLSSSALTRRTPCASWPSFSLGLEFSQGFLGLLDRFAQSGELCLIAFDVGRIGGRERPNRVLGRLHALAGLLTSRLGSRLRRVRRLLDLVVLGGGGGGFCDEIICRENQSLQESDVSVSWARDHACVGDPTWCL